MKIQVLWPRPEPSAVAEIAFAHRFCRRLSRRELNAADWREYHPRTQRLPKLESSDCVLFETDPQLVVSRLAAENMFKVLQEGGGAAVPLYNSTANPPQRADLPGVYTTVSTFFELAGRVAERPTPSATLLRTPYDSGCIMLYPEKAVSASRIGDFAWPAEVTLAENALVHRFENYAGMERADLWGRIPATAQTILDVGCGRGGLGRWLHTLARQADLTGVESSAALAEEALPYYGRVHVGAVETFEADCRYDCIVCGDILEHLIDPWKVVDRLAGWLNRDGCLLMSVPNAGHWSLVRDLAQGRWDYLPYGLTCVTHLRWFTESSLREMCEEAGLAIEILERQVVPPTPAGEVFIRKLVEGGEGDESSLRTHGFTIGARRV
ncbi:class I SAM-dependent methyltransferase [Methylohalobius crimeensis]|uniref:class I SAM-dependent methyltransferase n=1 Tax=Methylohalobius crimeensis TaxID=244365 RepID=UPI0003B4B735|nr:class I SAM-dependent methyltransferase [Methylohalobius crimeensis]